VADAVQGVPMTPEVAVSLGAAMFGLSILYATLDGFLYRLAGIFYAISAMCWWLSAVFA
jgi:hypothetical protein